MPHRDVNELAIYDVIIIGGGPCGLAVAARLRENTPSAIFTDEEHQRYHWIRQHGRQTSIKSVKTGRVREPCVRPAKQCSTLVLDSTKAEWMGKWDELFDKFQIDRLRSPNFFHVDPGDRDALLAFAYEQGRADELAEIRGVVGKEVSKHHRKKRASCQSREPLINERDRKDYCAPSTKLFAGHCKQVIRRYALLTTTFRKEVVVDIDYDEMRSLPEAGKLFQVKTNLNRYLARTVVCAVGPGNPPSLPGHMSGEIVPGACHAMSMQRLLTDSMANKLALKRAVNVLVVGGGLTSAQITDLAIRQGVTKVWHVMRGPLKVKHFDLDLAWLGKYKNQKQAEFWTADTNEERLKMIQDARQGGSITPTYRKILEKHIRGGRLSMHTYTSLCSKTWDAEASIWKIQTDPPVQQLPPMDFIYFATGVTTDVKTMGMLETIRRRHPTEVAGGLPCLNDSLMWCDDVPLFFTGKLASLQIGPGAANLSGARIGAEWISWGIQDVLSASDFAIEDGGAVKDFDEYHAARNRFDSLVDS